jgi:hypothetical protein
MAKKPPKPPGKNAPCPCGSGKVYKRCCLTAPAPTPADVVGGFMEALGDSEKLPKLLGWRDFDFDVDLHDPVISDITGIVSGSDGKPIEEAIALRTGLGVRRHATAEIRARLAEELERRAAGRSDRLVTAALIGLEDMKIDPIQIGLIAALYHSYILRRVLDLQKQIDVDAKEMDAELTRLAEELGTDLDADAVRRLADRLRPLGADALRYLEYFVPSEVDEAVAPLVELIAAHPGLRAARLLEGLLFEATTTELAGVLFDAFSKMPDLAWPLLLWRVQDPEEADYNRLAAYDLLVRARYAPVFTPLMREFRTDALRRRPMADLALESLAAKLAELGDRRAIGHAVQMIRDREIRPAGTDALRVAWAANGWWKEVDDALAALRRGDLVLVGRGETMNDHIRERFESGKIEAVEGAQFRLNMLQEDWNRAFHEDLDWLRPCDVHDPGPREQAVMQAFAAFAQSKMTSTSSGAEAARRFNELQHEWMRTPQADGRLPLAVLWEERRARSKHPSRDEAYIAEQLNDMYGAARASWEDGEIAAARSELEVILQLDPAHPFARRLLARISSM